MVRLKLLQQAGVYLENADESYSWNGLSQKFKNVIIQDRRWMKFSIKLKTVRHQIALNAGFENFRDYSFCFIKAFWLPPKECFDFHEAVAETVVPILNQLAET